MNGTFTDETAKAATQAECDKRNKHKSKFMADKTWKPLWSQEKGWHPALRPTVEVQRKERKPA